MYVVLIGHTTRLSKRLRVQMNEYFNLMNRAREGIIVLRRHLLTSSSKSTWTENENTDEANDYENEVLFETIAARKILK